MVSKKDINTECKIVEAAEKVFIENGMAGARMQQIADEAGINKALLHYYYRSKEKLFSIVFRTAIKALLPNLIKSFKTEGDFFDRLHVFVESYLNIIEKNPHLPGFVIHELNHRPEQLIQTIADLDIDIQFILDDIDAEIEKGRIINISPKHLIVNVISLCIFPVVARPMVTGVLFKGNKEEYKTFLKERRTNVADFVINSIKTK
ncbi:TetR/AcrR family transcriptional regulator [Lentimicrobium sp. L6]|uniref:TetR/AcrR family transcriptional regulator n=1 Tax=Lentimicrobium sp. L6 TaxID=2735916 RepID=UPI001555B582|nr:TetR/AcrR family transcriptional regulator [Lentimicrobium sp. L6]NPD85594.1 TetR/AcrR family transcriptional regulator [Lentimicrobium sp. L6]